MTLLSGALSPLARRWQTTRFARTARATRVCGDGSGGGWRRGRALCEFLLPIDFSYQRGLGWRMKQRRRRLGGKPDLRVLACNGGMAHAHWFKASMRPGCGHDDDQVHRHRQHRRQRRFIRSRDEQKVALSSNKKIFSRQLQLPRIRRLRMIRPKVIRISGTSPLTKFSGLQIGRSKRQSRFCRR